MKRVLDSSLVALMVGALGSAAANTAWTWSAGPVRVIAGLFTTALVPCAMHLWPRVPVTGWPTRFLRGLVMTYICGAAAVVNLAHAVLLLTDHVNARAENLWLAVLAITAVEALMVMASLARRTRPAATSGRSGTQGKRQDGAQDAGRVRQDERPIAATTQAPAAVGVALPVAAQMPVQGTRQDDASDSVLPSDPGQGGDTVAQDAPKDRQDNLQQDVQDAAQDAGQGDPPNTETDPVRWAVVELRAGRSAGYVVLGRQFPDLSERQAKDAAKRARTEQDAGLHVVRAGDRTA